MPCVGLRVTVPVPVKDVVTLPSLKPNCLFCQLSFKSQLCSMYYDRKIKIKVNVFVLRVLNEEYHLYTFMLATLP